MVIMEALNSLSYVIDMCSNTNWTFHWILTIFLLREDEGSNTNVRWWFDRHIAIRPNLAHSTMLVFYFICNDTLLYFIHPTIRTWDSRLKEHHTKCTMLHPSLQILSTHSMSSVHGFSELTMIDRHNKRLVHLIQATAVSDHFG